jgi:hypothetical protein
MGVSLSELLFVMFEFFLLHELICFFGFVGTDCWFEMFEAV